MSSLRDQDVQDWKELILKSKRGIAQRAEYTAQYAKEPLEEPRGSFFASNLSI